MSFLSIAFAALFQFLLATPVHAQGLNVTAIAAVNGSSVFQCWTLATPPTIARGAANFPLGDSTGSFLGVIPPRTYIGQAFAPSIQISIFLSGLAKIGLPNDNPSNIYMRGGRHGILIAADTANVSRLGHITDFPGDDTTVIAQFPIVGNRMPLHVVLHAGSCTSEDLESLG